MHITTNTVMEGWKQALNHILAKGTAFTGGDGRSCVETLNLTLTIQEPQQDIEAPIEIMQRFDKWVYPRAEEIKHIITAQRDHSAYEYLYGPRLFNYRGEFDQVTEFIVPLLKQDPTSRRAVAVLYDPVQDSKITNKETPGLIMVQCKLQEQVLHMTALIRSNDFFVGWPANIYQLHDLQRYIAKQLEAHNGSLTTISHSAHVYAEHQADIRSLLEGTPSEAL
jgi:thymidylate synthase (methanogen type)